MRCKACGNLFFEAELVVPVKSVVNNNGVITANDTQTFVHLDCIMGGGF